MLQYILECIAFQLVFLVIYDLFLKRETFFQWNRLYLIGTYILSLLLPWIKIEAFKAAVPQEYYVYPEFLWNIDNPPIVVAESEASGISFSWQEGIFFGGALLASLYFCFKLYQLYRLRKRGSIRHFPNFTRIVVKNSELAFSFFRSVFLGDKIVAREHQSIIEHELVHIEQKHTWDLLFFELMRIVGWFNPLVYVYQGRISELHEFIADAKVAKAHKKEQYEFLLSQVFQTEKISFINQFFRSSLIKKRIIMLQKSRSKRVWQLKYLLLVPLVLGMLFYTSSEAHENDEVVQEQTMEDTELITSITAKIMKDIKEQGSVYRVHSQFMKENRVHSDSVILPKELFFEQMILTNKYIMSMFGEMEEGGMKMDLNTILERKKRMQPSSARYKMYVEQKKTFQILDKNLKFSVKNNFPSGGTYIRLLDKNQSRTDNVYVFEVKDVKDLTGQEVRDFNLKVDEIFTQKGSKFKSLILTDRRYEFEVYEAYPFKEVESLPIKQEREVIKVQDTKNLTPEEEKMVFSRLRFISTFSSDWILLVTDNESYIKFLPSTGGSYIAGPEGQPIAATQILDYKPSNKEIKDIKEFVQTSAERKYLELLAERERQDNTESKDDLMAKYNELVAERNRLLKSADRNNPIIKNLDLQVKEIKKEVLSNHNGAVPFAMVDKVPVFPGCENDGDTRGCFYESMREHIRKNFRYPKEAHEQGLQGRVAIRFTMNTTGNITNVRTKGPHKLLEDEAVRIISSLPKIEPGVHDGEEVNVSFSVPITFKLSKEENKMDFANSSDIPFAMVHEVPIFPGCENIGDRRTCFQTLMQRHISKNFRYPREAQEKGIQGRVNIMFKITEDGTVQNVRLLGPHKLLEEEAARIISKLPKMIPGRHNDKVVNVPFSIPIFFRLQPSNEDDDYARLERKELDELPIEVKNQFKNMVPFSSVESAPIFPGCEDVPDQRACFRTKMANHISKHLQYPEEAKERGSQRLITIVFLIDAKGNVNVMNITKSGTDESLEKEAERVTKKLPKMIPAIHNGKRVNVPYVFAIAL